MKFLERVSAVLRSHVPAGSRLLVAVSGGSDSVALLHALRSLPYPLVVGHVDHQLRKNSGKDASFVRRLARAWDLPCDVARQNVSAYARSHGMGLEEAAREVRYRALAVMARRKKCVAMVTAHTADDQSETILMNFMRGSGTAGLAGIPEARSVNHGSALLLVRPFLEVRKTDLLAYLKRHKQPFRQDPTNASNRFMRNRIRHGALPFLEKLRPGFRERLVQAADIFRQEELFWDEQMARILNKTVQLKGRGFSVVLPKLLGYHKALSRRVLHHILPGSSFHDIEQVLCLACSSGKSGVLNLNGPWRAEIKNNRLLVVPKRTG